MHPAQPVPPTQHVPNTDDSEEQVSDDSEHDAGIHGPALLLTARGSQDERGDEHYYRRTEACCVKAELVLFTLVMVELYGGSEGGYLLVGFRSLRRAL